MASSWIAAVTSEAVLRSSAIARTAPRASARTFPIARPTRPRRPRSGRRRSTRRGVQRDARGVARRGRVAVSSVVEGIHPADGGERCRLATSRRSARRRSRPTVASRSSTGPSPSLTRRTGSTGSQQRSHHERSAAADQRVERPLEVEALPSGGWSVAASTAEAPACDASSEPAAHQGGGRASRGRRSRRSARCQSRWRPPAGRRWRFPRPPRSPAPPRGGDARPRQAERDHGGDRREERLLVTHQFGGDQPGRGRCNRGLENRPRQGDDALATGAQPRRRRLGSLLHELARGGMRSLARRAMLRGNARGRPARARRQGRSISSCAPPSAAPAGTRGSSVTAGTSAATCSAAGRGRLAPPASCGSSAPRGASSAARELLRRARRRLRANAERAGERHEVGVTRSTP